MWLSLIFMINDPSDLIVRLHVKMNPLRFGKLNIYMIMQTKSGLHLIFSPFIFPMNLCIKADSSTIMQDRTYETLE